MSTRQLRDTRATLDHMGKGDKDAVPDWLKDAVADNLKRFMTKAKLNDPQLAEAAGLNHPKQIGRLRRKETNPTLTTLCRLAGPLDVNVWEFLIPPQKATGPMLSGQESRPQRETHAVDLKHPSEKKRSVR